MNSLMVKGKVVGNDLLSCT